MTYHLRDIVSAQGFTLITSSVLLGIVILTVGAQKMTDYAIATADSKSIGDCLMNR